ncbi:hypothetical protein VP1G_11123 [Cytospora mali]|uniref:Uncharacterized protein n=1 Tax=Cytospora mali TaxID=578113 RepID=A0A194V587_CYTMA|nr:hypothetical protein VP1G_11123 [Valsa mali var. pyri (nom. inval.)]
MTSYSYPQIPGYQDPARLRRGPLVVMNPDTGSEAEGVRDEVVQNLRSRSHEEKTKESTPQKQAF